jgi:hypothetical protein
MQLRGLRNSKQHQTLKGVTMSVSVSVNTRASFLAVTMLAGWVTFAGTARAADAVESDKISSILSTAKIQAFQLKEDADLLETYTRSNVGWEAHADAVNTMKENVNKMGKLLEQLQNNRNDAAPWQQTAVDRIIPIAKELAANTTAAIGILNKNPHQITTGPYQEYVEALCDAANNLAATISDFADYGKTKERMNRLANKLEVPAGRM